MSTWLGQDAMTEVALAIPAQHAPFSKLSGPIPGRAGWDIPPSKGWATKFATEPTLGLGT